jgi:hypothetical protein
VRPHDSKSVDLTNKDHHLNRWWHTKKITPCQIAGRSHYRRPGTEFFNTIGRTETFNPQATVILKEGLEPKRKYI